MGRAPREAQFLFQLLGRLRVGRKLLLIYLLTRLERRRLHQRHPHPREVSRHRFLRQGDRRQRLRADGARRLVDVAMAGAGQRPSAERTAQVLNDLARAEREHGGGMQSARLNEGVREALAEMSRSPMPGDDAVAAALDACRALITRVGNQSNLILDPDLDELLRDVDVHPALSRADRVGRQHRPPAARRSGALFRRTAHALFGIGRPARRRPARPALGLLGSRRGQRPAAGAA